MRISDFSTLTFDCYGTLIDWESGLWNAIAPILERAAVAVGRDQLLETFARYESAQQETTPRMLYPELLAEVCKHVCDELGIDVADHEARAFGASVRDWPAFARLGAARGLFPERFIFSKAAEAADIIEANQHLRAENAARSRAALADLFSVEKTEGRLVDSVLGRA